MVMSDWMTTDRTLIRTVLQNLLQNAWKFTAGQDDDADSNPSIEFGMTRDADGRIRCYVRDNGAGFDPPTRTRYSRRSSDSTQQPSSPALASASLARWRAADHRTPRRPHAGRRRSRQRRRLLLHPRQRQPGNTRRYSKPGNTFPQTVTRCPSHRPDNPARPGHLAHAQGNPEMVPSGSRGSVGKPRTTPSAPPASAAGRRFPPCRSPTCQDPDYRPAPTES